MAKFEARFSCQNICVGKVGAVVCFSALVTSCEFLLGVLLIGLFSHSPLF